MNWCMLAGDTKPFTYIALYDTITRTVSVSLADPDALHETGMTLDRLTRFTGLDPNPHRYVWVNPMTRMRPVCDRRPLTVIDGHARMDPSVARLRVAFIMLAHTMLDEERRSA